MTTSLADTIVFDVDFNNVASGNRLKASLRFASTRRRPSQGEHVFLRDGEGNSCWARVAEIRDQIVVVDPEWESWAAESQQGAFDYAPAVA
jgi:hypothetical protein